MSIERTSVGLDVHALSVACGIDNETGRLTQQRLCPDPQEIRAWLADCPDRSGWSTRPGRQDWPVPGIDRGRDRHRGDRAVEAATPGRGRGARPTC